MPEERKGQCWCEKCFTMGGHHNQYWVCEDMPETDPKFCPHCGAELTLRQRNGKNIGIARRNADTARVDRVRAMLGPDCNSVLQKLGASPEYARGAEDMRREINAALDGPGGEEDE